MQDKTFLTTCPLCGERPHTGPCYADLRPMTKKHCAILEKLFAAEVSHAIEGTPYPVQIKGKSVAELESEGLIQKVTEVLPGRFPVKIEGYALTINGNAAYCLLCCDDEPI